MEENEVEVTSLTEAETNSISGTSTEFTSSVDDSDYCDVSNLHISSLTDGSNDENMNKI